MAFRRHSVPPSLGGLPTEAAAAPRRYLLPLLGVALCALAALLVLRAHRGTSPPPAALSAPVITPTGAEAVLAQLWPKREAALANDDEGAISVIDSGAALARDMNNVVEALAQGDSGGRPIPPLGPHSVTLNGPIGAPSGYPATFLADVQPRTAQGREPSTFLLVVTKASASSPWRVAMETSRGGSLKELNELQEELGKKSSGRQAKAQPRIRARPAATALRAGPIQRERSVRSLPIFNTMSNTAAHRHTAPSSQGHGRPKRDATSRKTIHNMWSTGQGIRGQSTYTPDWRDGVYTFGA